jgi:flagellar basal-body rod protein FlgB
MADSPIQFSGADGYLGAALSGLSARQRAIANNVANADTPGFHASSVPFEQVLSDALSNPSTASASASNATLTAQVTQAVPDDSTTLRADGNNVDIDRQMVDLAGTNLTYNTLSQVLASRLSLLNSVIKDGR